MGWRRIQLQKEKLTWGWVVILTLSLFACSSREIYRPGAADTTNVIVPTQTPTVAPEACVDVPSQPGVNPIGRSGAEISFAWDAGTFSATPEITLLSEAGEALESKKLCSTRERTAAFSVAQNQLQKVSLLIREPTGNLAAQFDELILRPTLSLDLGTIASARGFSITGQLMGPRGNDAVMEVLELKKSYPIPADGRWSTGALPPGRWSIALKNREGQILSWRRIAINSTDVALGEKQFNTAANILTPLWSGVLQDPFARFIVSADARYTQMRISDNAAFRNSYWMPFRSVFSFPISGSGPQMLFTQFRSATHETSDILVHSFRAELATNLETADAVVVNPTQSVMAVIDNNLRVTAASPDYQKNIHSIVRTFPPANATQHSVTIDEDDLPRNWSGISSELSVSLPLSIQSCGRHQVFVRFRDAFGRETKSLRREWNIRCWDSDLPMTPLSPRYDHGAAAFKFCFDPASNQTTSCSTAGAEQSHGIFIWGGKGETGLLADGALLRKFRTGWRWDMLPANPDLTARTNPQIVAGANNILVWGGEDVHGNPMAGYGIYRLSTSGWETPPPGKPPAPRLHATVAFIKHFTNDENSGAFTIYGGETKNPQTGQPVLSPWWDILYEKKNGLTDSNWANYSIIESARISRASVGYSRTGHVLWMVSGLGIPSAESSGNPELTSRAIALVSATEDNIPDVYSLIYNSANSRVGALNGHVVISERATDSMNFASFDDFLETTSPCVFGGQKYTDVLPSVCQVLDGANPFAYQSFCRRLYDAYNFAPVGKRSVCFRPASIAQQAPASPIRYLRNFFLPMTGAPSERRLLPKSTASFPRIVFTRLFVWSGMAAAGGEYLSDGAIYEVASDRWIPITPYEAPAPRDLHTATALPDLERVFIFGGLTATGPSNQGVFYALP